MGIIKRADLETYARDAVAMDLGDMQRRGEAIVAAAQQQAAQILKDANDERARLIGDAAQTGEMKGYQEGFANGTEAGHALGTDQARQAHEQEIRALLAQWNATVDEWESQRSELMVAARTEVITLAAHIAARVIKRVIDLDPEVVVDQLELVLETLVTPTDIRVHVHPNDMELLNRVMPAMIERCASCNHAQLVEDPKLTPGSCVISTKGGGEIDASIAKQFDRIVATLLPAHRGPDYDELVDDDKKESNTPKNESKDDAA